MIKRILQLTVILSVIICILWAIFEPGFDSLSALLGSIIALIPTLVEQNETVNHAAHASESQGTTKGFAVEPSPKRSAKLQPSGPNLSEREWAIVANLQEAFMLLKNLMPTVCVVSIIFLVVLFAMMVFEAEEIAVIFIGLFWLFFILNVYVFMVKKWYERVEISGFYRSKISVSERKTIKHALYQQEWGSDLLNLYMRTLVWFLLKPNKNDANNAEKQRKLG